MRFFSIRSAASDTFSAESQVGEDKWLGSGERSKLAHALFPEENGDRRALEILVPLEVGLFIKLGVGAAERA